jgi:hypothetical protein
MRRHTNRFMRAHRGDLAQAFRSSHIALLDSLSGQILFRRSLSSGGPSSSSFIIFCR